MFFNCSYKGLPGMLFNLPGWRWATITKVALDRLSRSLHSDVCDSDGCCDAVVHSTISGSGNRRTRAVPNSIYTTKLCTTKLGPVRDCTAALIICPTCMVARLRLFSRCIGFWIGLILAVVPRNISTALISWRMNLSPFTKGSRVLRALNVIYSIFVRICPLTIKQVFK